VDAQSEARERLHDSGIPETTGAWVGADQAGAVLGDPSACAVAPAEAVAAIDVLAADVPERSAASSSAAHEAVRPLAEAEEAEAQSQLCPSG
jgi:hypothetical protein